MNKLLKDVVKFHKAYGQPVPKVPKVPSEDRVSLRIRLIEEELNEFRNGAQKGDLVESADALIDLLYVVNGAIIEFGLKDIADKLHDEVQNSNMSKLGEDGKPLYRADGKVAKGPNFFEPNLKAIIEKKISK